MNDLIQKAVKDKSKNMLKKAEKKSSRVIDDNEIARIFGSSTVDEIDFNPEINIAKSKKSKSPESSKEQKRK